MSDHATVLVTGANGLVGSRICQALLDRGADVHALVRRAGTAPSGTTEVVGDFADAATAAEAVRDVDAVVTTVHPLDGSAEQQRTVGVDGTVTFVKAAADAGVGLVVHLSTAGVYVRTAEVDDVDEAGQLVPDGPDDYPVVKRDLDAELAEIDGPTRVLLRPPAILGAADSSVWNTKRPEAMRTDASARQAVGDATFAWVHVDDLAALAADVATGAVATADDPARGPVAGGCTPVNVAGEPATQRDYVGTVAEAIDVEPEWTDEPAWHGRLLTDRAAGWGWAPSVSLADALEELAAGLR